MSRDREDYGGVLGLAFVVLGALMAICTALGDDAPTTPSAHEKTVLPAQHPAIAPGVVTTAATAPQPPRWKASNGPPAPRPAPADVETARDWTVYGTTRG